MREILNWQPIHLTQWRPQGSPSTAITSPLSSWWLQKLHINMAPDLNKCRTNSSSQTNIQVLCSVKPCFNPSVPFWHWKVCRTQVCWWCQPQIECHPIVWKWDSWEVHHQSKRQCWMLPATCLQAMACCHQCTFWSCIILYCLEHLQCHLKWQGQGNSKCNLAGVERRPNLKDHQDFGPLVQVLWNKDAILKWEEMTRVDINLCQPPSHVQSISHVLSWPLGMVSHQLHVLDIWIKTICMICLVCKSLWQQQAGLPLM